MVENILFANFKPSVEPLEPKQAPINNMSCVADKGLLLSLEQISEYINDTGHKINIQYGSQCNRTERQDKNNFCNGCLSKATSPKHASSKSTKNAIHLL